MYPKLITLLGPHRGKAYDLNEPRITVGRLPANHLYLPEQGVSRQHCVFETEGERVILRDLESRNGTRVNGMPILERALEDGDLIEIGDSQFMFLLKEPGHEDTTTAVTIQETNIDTAVAVKVPWAEGTHAPRAAAAMAAAAESGSGRKARDLDVLLKINQALNSVRELDALERELVSRIFEVIPAERGAILLAREAGSEWESTFGWRRGEEGQRPVEVSRTVLQQVIGEKLGVLSTDPQADPALRGSESLYRARVQAVLCVPLMTFDKLIGVLYLDTSDRAHLFDRDHVALLMGIAGVAAPALEHALRVARLEAENRRLMEEIQIEHHLVGESERIRQAQRFIAKVAPSDSTVLIKGESGTGKELVARAIHYLSRRASKSFAALNCAAIPENLLEAELFGHERGAFTGAAGLRRGKLEMASGGTFFLDEIGELALPLQAKLLRVLQEREFERVGGTQPVKVDLRIIAATNRDLEESIRAGAFRRDLYFRLNVVAFTLPTLRERREDIPLLATYFIAKLSGHSGRRVRGISNQAKACLMRYDWPGNVRELENAIERAIVLGSGEVIEIEDLPESLLESQPAQGGEIPRFHEAVQQTKRQLILEAVEAAQSNYTEAAKRLGLHPNYLHRLIRNLNLREELRKHAQ
ncbi:MAG: sigma 54-interacting transcriptional regulator [Terriglobia bacterium]